MAKSEKLLKIISSLIENGILTSKDIKREITNSCNKIYRLKGPRMFNLLSYIKLQKIIKENKYDIVHSHQPRSDYMVFIIKKLFFSKNVFKWIVSIHGKYDSYLNNDFKKRDP